MPARLAEVHAATRPKQTGKKTRKKAAETAAPRDLTSVLRDLEKNASKPYRADMAARYGIVTKAPVYGTPVAKLRKIAKTLGVDHELANALWRTGIHDARMLATMVADPAQVTAAQMDRWAKDFDNWALVDTACFSLFDRTPDAFKQIEKWARAKDEFVKRAAFALLASCALHGFGSEKDHLRGLGLIEREAGDARNFVKKGVSWALRAIGGKNSPKLCAVAHALARKLSESNDPTERWNGKDALRAFAKV
jgi:3-methyladenine DNA glycosylase AlkD